MPYRLNTQPPAEAIETLGLVGRLGTPQLACLRSWRRAGVACAFLHADLQPLRAPVARLLAVPCTDLGPLRPEDEAWVQAFIAAVERHGVTALTCVSEPISQMLWALQPRLPPGVRVVSARPEQIALLASKQQQRQAAEAAGLPTLPTWLLRPGAMACADAAAIPGLAYPLVLRPDVQRQAEPGFKLAVVDNPAALQARLPALQRPGAVAWVAQPLVQGPNLVVHAWRHGGARVQPADDAQPGPRAGHVGFVTEIKHQGLAVLLRPVSLPPALQQGCARMAAGLGLTGVFHFDFVQCARSGQLYFLDLNPRLGGTTGKVLAAGYDEPLALVGTLQGRGLPQACVVAPRLRPAGGRHQALGALLRIVRGARSVADHPIDSRLRTCAALLAFLLFGRDEVLRAEALGSTLAFVLHQVFQRLPGRPLDVPTRPAPKAAVPQ
jgi:hypothetical protein